MRKYIIFPLFFGLMWMTEAKELDYKRVLMSGTGMIGDLVVRYLLSPEEPCLIVQNLVADRKGTVLAESRICSLDGKSFLDGYTLIEFKEGVFENGKLFFEVGVTPLEPVGETVKKCEVIFRNKLADRLSCIDKQ